MNRTASSLFCAAIAAVALSACSGASSALSSNATNGPSATSNITQPSIGQPSRVFNRRGDILIADQFNNRVIEVDPATHHVVWSFGGSSKAGPDTIVGTNDAQRVGPLTLMAGTGVPPSNPPFEPGCGNGCPDNRVIIVNPTGHIVWQYGKAGVAGSGPDRLNTPVQDTYLPNHHVLITDQANERVIEVNRQKDVVWQYGMTGVSGNGPDQLNNPNSAELLENGHILIADENNNRVIEVTRGKQIVWQYPDPVDPTKLNGAAFASRLENGHTLITDSNNNRIIEIDRNKNVVWAYSTLVSGGNSNPLPTRAVRLQNGDTLISDQFNDRVIEVRKTGPTSGMIVFTQGMLNMPGNGFNELNAPYDAKVIGDYTGLTPPPDQQIDLLNPVGN